MSITKGNTEAGLIFSKSGQILIQSRENKKIFFYPNYWECFECKYDLSETEIQALQRELYEKLNLSDYTARFFTKIELKYSAMAKDKVERSCYKV